MSIYDNFNRCGNNNVNVGIEIFPRVFLGNIESTNINNLSDINKKIGLVISCIDRIGAMTLFGNYDKVDIIRNNCKRLNIKHVHIDIKDTEYEQTLYDDKRFLFDICTKLNKYMKDNPNRGVLIHCYAGINRSSTLISAYGIYLGYNLSCIKKIFLDKRRMFVMNTKFNRILEEFYSFISYHRHR